MYYGINGYEVIIVHPNSCREVFCKTIRDVVKLLITVVVFALTPYPRLKECVVS